MAQRWLLCEVVFFFMLLHHHVEAQIPSECANTVSLPPGGTSVRKCCPMYNNMECGGPDRGKCTQVFDQIVTPTLGTDPRATWPMKYFTHTCVCTDNYGGVNCGSCAYGHYPHPTCDEMLVGTRKNLKHYSSSEWDDYIDIIKKIRKYDYGYKAIVNGQQFNPLTGWASIASEARDITLYRFFVWTHYLVAKDSESQQLDYAHEGAGFLTWHRQMLLWLEWKIQEMLRVQEMEEDYYKFRLPYWHWTEEGERRRYFTEDRLGESTYDETQKHITTGVTGTLFDFEDVNEETICWSSKRGPDGSNCDPTIGTGRLKRCPKRPETSRHSDPCNDNEYWPTTQEAWDAVEKLDDYDTKDSNNRYGVCPREDSFRTRVEGFVVQRSGMCATELVEGSDSIRQKVDLMCGPPNSNILNDCARSRSLHNTIHILLGAADIDGIIPGSALTIPDDQLGVMSHVAASPNDPIFINHHAMIDCIFEDWFKKENYGDYPDDVMKDGHGKNDYIVPFIPLFKHVDMFKSSMNFGYMCGAVPLSPLVFVIAFTSVLSLIFI